MLFIFNPQYRNWGLTLEISAAFTCKQDWAAGSRWRCQIWIAEQHPDPVCDWWPQSQCCACLRSHPAASAAHPRCDGWLHASQSCIQLSVFNDRSLVLPSIWALILTLNRLYLISNRCRLFCVHCSSYCT